MLPGTPVILPQGRSDLPSGITADFGQSIWVSFTAATMVPLRASTMREKSLERRIPLSRSFHLSGRLGAAFASVRCWLATTADRRSASIGTAMWLDTLRARMAGERSCGREAGASATSAFCPAAITAARLTSTTWMRLRVHLEARPVSVPSFGRQTAIYAILGRYREIRRARLAQSIIMEMSLGTRKVHGACALFCGLKQLECRISGCSPVETPVERSVSTTWGLWLELRQARRKIAPLFGQDETGMRDLNGEASLTFGVVFVEAHAINNRGQILVMGIQYARPWKWRTLCTCAPAPPSSFLLTPSVKANRIAAPLFALDLASLFAFRLSIRIRPRLLVDANKASD